MIDIMLIDSFDVVFCDHYDRHRSFYIVAYYISEMPVDGRFLREKRTIFRCDNLSTFNKDYSRIINLLTPARYSRTVVDTSRINYDSWFSCDLNPLFSMHYTFCHAEKIRALCRALDFYGIKYNLADVDADLPF